jgi:hypothetical protein
MMIGHLPPMASKPSLDWSADELGIDSVRRIALSSRSEGLQLARTPAIGRSEAEHLAWIACSDILDEEGQQSCTTAIEILHAVQQRFGLPERLSDRIVVAAQYRCHPAPAFQAAVRLRLKLEYLYSRAHAPEIGDCLFPKRCQGAIIAGLSHAEIHRLAVRMADPAFLEGPQADLPLARQMAEVHGRKPEIGRKLLDRAEWRRDPEVRESLRRWGSIPVLCRLFESAAPGEEARDIFRIVASRSPTEALKLFQHRAHEWQRLAIEATDLLPLFSAGNPDIRRKALIAFGRAGHSAAAAA